MDDPSEVVRLRAAIEQHQHVWDTTTQRWDPRRDDANDDLWEHITT